MIFIPLKLENDTPDGLEDPYDVACVVFCFKTIFLYDSPPHRLTALSPDYRVKFPMIFLKHLRSITVLLYPLRIDFHFKIVVCVPDFRRYWHRWFFNMLIDWHLVNGKIHFLVVVLSKNFRHHVAMSLIGALGERKIDMTVNIIRYALEDTYLLYRKILG